MAKRQPKIREYVDPAQFGEFKEYTRRMLADIFNAKVTPYCNNGKMQEITVAWDPNPKQKFGGYPPENMTHLVQKPYKNPLEMGNYLFKETLNILMRQAGFKDNTSGFVSGARKGQFAVNMVHAFEKSGKKGDYAPVIPIIHVRANGDLQKAAYYITGLSDENLDAACRESLATLRMAVGPAPG
jgi:hypothetical protein